MQTQAGCYVTLLFGFEGVENAWQLGTYINLIKHLRGRIQSTYVHVNKPLSTA